MFPHIQLAMLKVLAAQYADQDGIVHFDYKHPCGNWEKIYVHVFCKDCSYIRAPGLFADWHGSVAEKFSFDPKRVYLEDGQPPRHQLLFQNLDTFFGMERNLSFSQVGPYCLESDASGKRFSLSCSSVATYDCC